MEQKQSTTVQVQVLGVRVVYSRLEGVLVFVGRPCGNAWAVACRLARQLGAKPVAVGL